MIPKAWPRQRSGIGFRIRSCAKSAPFMTIEDDIAFFERVPTLNMLGRAGAAHSRDRRREPLRALGRGAVQRRRSGRLRLRGPGRRVQPDGAASRGRRQRRGRARHADRGARAAHRDRAPGHRHRERAVDGAAHPAHAVPQDARRLSGRRQEAARHHRDAHRPVHARDLRRAVPARSAGGTSARRPRRGCAVLKPPSSRSPARGRTAACCRDSSWRS